MAQGIVENQLHDLTLAEAATLLYIMCNICNIFESRVVVEQSTNQNKTKFLALTVCVISTYVYLCLRRREYLQL